MTLRHLWKRRADGTGLAYPASLSTESELRTELTDRVAMVDAP